MASGEQGLELALYDVDARGQGRVFEHVVWPHANGYVPIAYVLTDATHDGTGIGYQGSIAEVRQGEDGKVALGASGADNVSSTSCGPDRDMREWTKQRGGDEA